MHLLRKDFEPRHQSLGSIGQMRNIDASVNECDGDSCHVAIPAQMTRTNNAARPTRPSACSPSCDESFAYIDRPAREWSAILSLELLTV